MKEKNVVVLSTAANQKEARIIARKLVEKKLAACVNIISKVDSWYIWKGKLEKSKEILLIVKTKESLFKKATQEIRRNHSYDVPEVIALPIINGSCAYLKWIDESLNA